MEKVFNNQDSHFYTSESSTIPPFGPCNKEAISTNQNPNNIARFKCLNIPTWMITEPEMDLTLRVRKKIST